jgi:hypothetical protein
MDSRPLSRSKVALRGYSTEVCVMSSSSSASDIRGGRISGLPSSSSSSTSSNGRDSRGLSGAGSLSSSSISSISLSGSGSSGGCGEERIGWEFGARAYEQYQRVVSETPKPLIPLLRFRRTSKTVSRCPRPLFRRSRPGVLAARRCIARSP